VEILLSYEQRRRELREGDEIIGDKGREVDRTR
jgi:hypothetical protein